VGTDSQSGYELWDLRNRRFDHTHNCTILENEFPTSEDFPLAEQYRKRRRGAKRNPPTNLLTNPPTSPVIEEPQRLESPERPILDTIIVERGPPPPAPHESSAAQSKLPASDKPSLEEALSEAPKWRQAMLKELQSINENNVWQLHPPPPDRRVLRTKWVFTDAQGNVERYKARLVVQGFRQQFRFDYDETYSPVIRIDNIRLLFAIAAHFRYHGVVVWHVDFWNAFQNGGADFRIYIRQPPSFTNPQYPHHVLLLLKSLSRVYRV
jgi:Reverse transcriptase (RNA-dependent DNA polymerase)